MSLPFVNDKAFPTIQAFTTGIFLLSKGSNYKNIIICQNKGIIIVYNRMNYQKLKTV